jgi:phenylpropionate dioxygenase-like ring-hydroxylating dioxygenase large terminal subunit
MDVTKLPFSMKPVGWFQIGWSAEIAPGTVKPLKFFDQDLVAFRTADGRLAVLDAHCHHLGAHIGYGGKVKGDCVACPYHGWEWGTDGRNVRIPYADRPVNKKLRAWPVREQHECMFLWHDPTGSPPRFDLPHIFDSFHAFSPGSPDDYYPAWPQATLLMPKEAVHPQITFENSVDPLHFRYVHDAPMDPLLLEYDVRDAVFRTLFGFKSAKTNDIAMLFETQTCGVAASFNVFKGSYNYRVLFSVTPVDAHTSDLFYSIWWPRKGDPSERMSDALQERIRKDFLYTVEQDLMIWRTQAYVEHPIFPPKDLKPFLDLRAFQTGFYDLPPLPASPPAP